MELFRRYTTTTSEEYIGVVINGYKQGIHWDFDQTTSMKTYLNDELNGSTYYWYKGKILFKHYHINYKINGIQYNWCLDGKLDSIRNFLDDEPYGLDYGWLSNGEIDEINKFSSSNIKGKKYEKIYRRR